MQDEAVLELVSGTSPEQAEKIGSLRGLLDPGEPQRRTEVRRLSVRLCRLTDKGQTHGHAGKGIRQGKAEAASVAVKLTARLDEAVALTEKSASPKVL